MYRCHILFIYSPSCWIYPFLSSLLYTYRSLHWSVHSSWPCVHPLCLKTFSMCGHTQSQLHERAATWLKLTSVARRSASGTQHTATSHSPTLQRCFCACACLFSSSCAYAHRRVFVCAAMKVYFCECVHVTKVVLLPGARFEARMMAKICARPGEELVRTWRFRSQRHLHLQEWYMWACVAGTGYYLVPDIYNTLVLRQKHEQRKNMENGQSVQGEWRNEKETT